MGLSNTKEVTIIEMNKQELQRFVGTFQMGDNKNMQAKTKVKNGKLVVKTGSNHELEPIGPLTFVDLKDPETLIFQEDENGIITGIMVEGPGIILKKIK